MSWACDFLLLLTSARSRPRSSSRTYPHHWPTPRNLCGPSPAKGTLFDIENILKVKDCLDQVAPGRIFAHGPVPWRPWQGNQRQDQDSPVPSLVQEPDNLGGCPRPGLHPLCGAVSTAMPAGAAGRAAGPVSQVLAGGGRCADGKMWPHGASQAPVRASTEVILASRCDGH
jgi:hypothetical protein